ncbi:MAG: polysaccharide deacetylase family protein [Xanthomonadales bacterium]|nr:polysaccharide deacetylase family protein [Xanthomonadales bacterium]
MKNYSQVRHLARSLGLADDARIVIAHIDDVGMCHGANKAFFDLANHGFITCGSVMVPCPWFRELALQCQSDPTLDMGVHLTLTSEWSGYRWRPLSTTSRHSGLIDDDGYMWRNVKLLRDHLVPEAAESEMRAQIDTAIAAGVDMTHIDAHMGAALMPELMEIYLKLAQEYRLPAVLPRVMEQYLSALNNTGEIDARLYDPILEELCSRNMPVLDFFSQTLGVSAEQCESAYKDLIQSVPVGLSFLAFHCNAPGDIETIIPPRAHWRTDEYALFGSANFLDWLRAQNLHLVGFRKIRDWYRALPVST